MNRQHYTEVLAQIEAHPEKWDQAAWCGAAYCFAGHSQLLVQGHSDGATVQRDAMRNLDIDEMVAYYLFHSRRTLEDFRNFAAMDDDQQFAAAVQAEPWAALLYPHACARMSDQQFAAAVRTAPRAALLYPHACERMTDEQFAVAAQAAPGAAILYPHACERLTDEQFEVAVEAAPGVVLQYPHARARLTR